MHARRTLEDPLSFASTSNPQPKHQTPNPGAKKAKVAADGTGCGACSDSRWVPAAYTAACQSCVLSAPEDGGKGLCANLERETSQEAVGAYYKCLAGAKGSDAPSNCLQCYRNGDVKAAGKCYECMGKLSSGNAIHCSHCWTANRMNTKDGAQSQAEKCEKCIIDKDKAQGEPSQCW